MSEIKYHNYKVADVRAWLYEGADNGLSEQVISKTRANAILHNPYIKDDMVIVVSATDNDQVVGFTAMFPERLERPNVWLTCPTTLYAHPDYAGEFIGYYVSKALHDTADGRLVIGSDLASETILIDKLLGLKADVLPRKRIILRRTIPWDTFRHMLSSMYEPIRRWQQYRAIQRVMNSIPANLRLEYTNFVDVEMYDFIVKHSGDAIFVRSWKMLNWIMAYPFVVDAPLAQFVGKQNAFPTQLQARARNLFKVRLNNQLIGVCLFVTDTDNANIRMLYIDDTHKETVYAILLKHILKSGAKTLHSVYTDFNGYVDRVGVAFKMYEEPLVFTHPKTLLLPPDKQIQGMDGDMFV